MNLSIADASTARRILIINVTRIGDTLLATPAIRAIAAHFPNADVTVLGHPDRAEVLQNLAYLKKIGHITKKSAWMRGWKDVLSAPEYDYAFVWGQDQALVRYALRKARRVIAERQRSQGLSAQLAYAFDAPVQNSVHAVAWFLAMPRAVGIAPQGFGVDYVVSSDEALRARSRLADKLGATNYRPTICFQVASFATKAWRDWPMQRWIDLALLIIQRYPDARFMCFGAEVDQPRIAELQRSLPGRVLNFAGKTSLRETAALMSLVDVYVGIDTGPTHLFSALKRPMVVMYHPMIPSALYKPLGHPVFSAIDHAKAGPNCRDKIPMDEIKVDTVWHAVVRAIEADPSESPGMPSPGIDAGVDPWPGDALPYP
jgi:heptosyltransferase-3